MGTLFVPILCKDYHQNASIRDFCQLTNAFTLFLCFLFLFFFSSSQYSLSPHIYSDTNSMDRLTDKPFCSCCSAWGNLLYTGIVKELMHQHYSWRHQISLPEQQNSIKGYCVLSVIDIILHIEIKLCFHRGCIDFTVFVYGVMYIYQSGITL